MSFLTLSNIKKSFGSVQVVHDFNMAIEKGEFVSFLGPSGCGKTTVLRMIAGFEIPTGGSIVINGKDQTTLRPNQRNIGMVFQAYALFPNMNVYENVAFGLKVAGKPKAEIDARVKEMLQLIHLEHLADRYPYQMSGGQQQRVALARSLVLEPKILLLDEPFASLDQHLRERLREEVRDIQQRLGITTLFVTHGQDEALSMADRIVVMANGRTEQIDRPNVIYREPQTPFVAGFIGTMNLIEGVVSGGNFSHAGLTVPLPVSDGPAILAIRPEAVDLTASETPQASVHRVTDYGTHGLVDLDLPDGIRIKSMVAHPDLFRAGQGVDIQPRAVTAFRDNRQIYRS